MTQVINQTLSIPPIDIAAPETTETFTCAMGCFWAPDCMFGAMDGVVRTRVGYAGGTTEYPTYRNLGDHIETIQIDYDPEKISYEQLLDIFWNSHKPTRTVWKRQYTSALFFQDDNQEKLTRESREKIASKLDEKVNTELIGLKMFHMAEMYHQKYHLQGYEGLMIEYRDIYNNSIGDIINSTSAARVNGFIGGYGDISQFEKVFSDLGLSDDSFKLLTNIIKRNRR